MSASDEAITLRRDWGLTTMRQITPHGAWPSPLSAQIVAADRISISGVAMKAAGDVLWSETRPTENGRTVILRQDPSGDTVELLPAGWDVRTRVHEYGGAAWRLIDDRIVFSDARDGRLYRNDRNRGDPAPLTPAPPFPHADRYADIEPLQCGSAVLAVREQHRPAGVRRDLVLVPLDGSASGSCRELSIVWSGSDFVASPRLSPDGRRLAFLTWDHPVMPWDGCQLRLLDLASPTSAAVIAGNMSESVLQPTWTPDGRLLVASDRSGWWNLYQVNGNDLESLWPAPEEFSEAPWLLGLSTFAVLDDHRLVARHGTRTNRLSVLDVRTGSFTEVQLPVADVEPLIAADGDHVVVVGQTGNARSVVLLVDLATDVVTAVHWAIGEMCPDDFIPTARIVGVPAQDDRAIPAVIYPPTSPDAAGRPGERPPWLVAVHGGPTSRSAASLLEISFFTSRGFGVVDVDYAGSTGWGRAWRQALYGQWGILDVEDCVAVARWLVDNGLAEDGRVAIRGGSAGGWTALGALTRSAVFGAAVSLCGVVDATLLAEQTHDFESHYLDWLIGALPEAKTHYMERSPLSHVDTISAPVLLLQGRDDPVVPHSQSEAIVAALQARGIPYGYLVFEDEQHGLKKAENRIAALQAELSFYGQVFGFNPPDTPRLVIHRPAN